MLVEQSEGYWIHASLDFGAKIGISAHPISSFFKIQIAAIEFLLLFIAVKIKNLMYNESIIQIFERVNVRMVWDEKEQGMFYNSKNFLG